MCVGVVLLCYFINMRRRDYKKMVQYSYLMHRYFKPELSNYE